MRRPAKERSKEVSYFEAERRPSQARREVSTDFGGASCDMATRPLLRGGSATRKTGTSLYDVAGVFFASAEPAVSCGIFCDSLRNWPQLCFIASHLSQTKHKTNQKGTISLAGFRRFWLLPAEACSCLHRASPLTRTAFVPMAVQPFRSSGESVSSCPAPALTSSGNE